MEDGGRWRRGRDAPDQRALGMQPAKGKWIGHGDVETDNHIYNRHVKEWGPSLPVRWRWEFNSEGACRSVDQPRKAGQ